ncbi:DUF4249 family protein [Pedobacter sp. LMG 31464]|uniref:DUF4249 family protein n=1 Tax=Pedobacter planticolens TaxID=2679964 RepID=A0A923DX64_9SPHI|nr:DUF4249 domain-containing protein [Pedobacter planticolens]MBB2144745.1 DUF4249 family protein [Pedobacter planticolens]
MKKFKNVYLLILCLAFFACKEPYAPTVTTINHNFLIIEGFINTGADSTIINLSRSVLVDNKNTANPELNATVTVESDANNSYTLNNLGKGVYASAGLNLDNSKKYRLRIKTSKGVTYLSDFVESKISPVIDAVGFDVKDDGIQVHVNTHDDSNNSKYFRWEYKDTWQFNSDYYSVLSYNGIKGPGFQDRLYPDENIATCWTTKSSNNILLGSTLKLEKDVINKAPLTFIESSSEKISVRYSILVKQYVITKEAFEFWEKLKKNTENLGSIFDTQPSELRGNVYNVADRNEPVVGFIGAGVTQTKRFFINKKELPNWALKYPYKCAELDTLNNFFATKAMQTGLKTPLAFVLVDGVTYILLVDKECGDCTIRGVNRKPSFW